VCNRFARAALACVCVLRRSILLELGPGRWWRRLHRRRAQLPALPAALPAAVARTGAAVHVLRVASCCEPYIHNSVSHCATTGSLQWNVMNSSSPAEAALQYVMSSWKLNTPDADPHFATLPQLDRDGKETGAMRRTPRADPCPSKPYPPGCAAHRAWQLACSEKTAPSMAVGMHRSDQAATIMWVLAKRRAVCTALHCTARVVVQVLLWRAEGCSVPVFWRRDRPRGRRRT
jgi:hypothetical protein